MTAFSFGRIMIVTKARLALVLVRSPPTTIFTNSSRNLCSGKDNITAPSKEKASSSSDSEQSIKSQNQNDEKTTEIKKVAESNLENKSNAKDKIHKEAPSYDQLLKEYTNQAKILTGQGRNNFQLFYDKAKVTASKRFSIWKQDHASDIEWYAVKVGFFMKSYENFTGLTEVKAAQALVIREEKRFIEAQEQRREAQQAVSDNQNKLKSIRSELERTPRGDDKYLELVTQEHTFIKEELSLLHTYQGLERNERSSFKLLSVAVRDSHEKERSQGEKTKYYSLIFSLVGVCVGGLISVFTNERRMRKMRQMIKEVGSGVTSSGAAGAGAIVASGSMIVTKEAMEDLQKGIEKSSDHLTHLDEKLNEVQQSLQEQLKKKPEVVTVPVAPVKSDQPNFEHMYDLIGDSISKSFKQFENGLYKNNAEQIGGLDSRLNRFFQNNALLLESIGKEMSARDQKFLHTFNQKNTNAYNTFSSRLIDIEEIVKDVRSIAIQNMTNVQATPAPPPKVEKHYITEQILTPHSKISQEDIDRNTEIIMNSVESALMNHEQRITNQMIAVGVSVALFTPVVSYIINKFF